MRILVAAVVAALASPLLLLAGCATPVDCAPPSAPGSVAYVLGEHANAPAAADPRVLADAVTQQRKLTVVEADGVPRVVVSTDLAAAKSQCEAQRRERAQRLDQLRGQLAGVRPENAETDLLTAIDLGARALTVAPKRMVVESPGLPTKGAVLFQEPGMLQAVPDEVADNLRERNELPDLTGVDVQLRGFGDTMAPQQPLTIAERKNVIAIWTAVLTKAGAHVTVDSSPRQGRALTDAPPVTPVPVQPITSSATGPQVLPAAEYFAGDSADLVDRGHAKETLRPFAEKALAENASVDLVGTTARVGDRDGQVRLAEARAQALREVLVQDLHLPAERVHTAGEGSYGPTYVTDHDAAGHLLPAPAAQNRTVRISLRKGQ